MLYKYHHLGYTTWETPVRRSLFFSCAHAFVCVCDLSLWKHGLFISFQFSCKDYGFSINQPIGFFQIWFQNRRAKWRKGITPRVEISNEGICWYILQNHYINIYGVLGIHNATVCLNIISLVLQNESYDVIT